MSWGFMKGLSQGIGGFSVIMEQQKERDYQAKKDELAFKRQKTLEGLRAQNQKAAEQQRRNWQLEDQEREDYNKTIQAQTEEDTYQRRRGESREDYVWKIGQAAKLDRQTSEAKMQAKKDTWDTMLSEGMLDNYSPEQIDAVKAMFIYDIKLPKGAEPKQPTDEMFKIANELVINNAPEGTPAEQLYESIKATAYGLANDPRQVRSKLSGNGDADSIQEFNPQEDMPVLMNLVSKANKGDSRSLSLIKSNIEEMRRAGVDSKYINQIERSLKPQSGEPDMTAREAAMAQARGEQIPSNIEKELGSRKSWWQRATEYTPTTPESREARRAEALRRFQQGQ